MRKLFVLVTICLFAVPLSAAFFTPIDGVFPDAFTPEAVSVVADQMQTVADEFNKDDVIALAGNQEEFAKANNNANSSTLLNGSLYTRTEIRTVAVGAGTSLGTVDPAGFATIADDIEKGKDSPVGASFNAFTMYASVDGANYPLGPLQKCLFDLKLGYMQDNSVVSNFTFDSFILGGGVRYKVYQPELESSIMHLRPITIGTGVYYTSSKMTFAVDDLKQSLYDATTQITTDVVTDLEFSVENKSTTVPLELVSSARFFGFLNAIAGTGCDFVFGETTVDLSADTRASVSHDLLPIAPIKAPDLKLNDSKTAKNADLFRYKLLTGFGFEMAMVTFDVPVTYYPLDNGLTMSMVAAATF